MPKNNQIYKAVCTHTTQYSVHKSQLTVVSKYPSSQLKLCPFGQWSMFILAVCLVNMYTLGLACQLTTKTHAHVNKHAYRVKAQHNSHIR